jgi:hypothetical protein
MKGEELMNKMVISTFLILILLSSMTVSIFFGTLQVAKADTQSSDSNGDPNTINFRVQKEEFPKDAIASLNSL